MWGFAEVSGIIFTVLRVYGPILHHSHAHGTHPQLHYVTHGTRPQYVYT